jgi:hypothetical protein
MTTTFKDILETLPATDGIAAIVLLDAAGETLTRLENKPGTAGSVRVYHALIKKHSHINRAAALKACSCTRNILPMPACIRANIRISTACWPLPKTAPRPARPHCAGKRLSCLPS